MKALVLYHDNCPDGFTAAWAVWRALGDDAEYRAMNYGQHMPSQPSDYGGRRLIFVDFSLPRAELEALVRAGAHVEVYDHHKTAQADLFELPGAGAVKVVFDMERSGAGIAWDEFHPDIEGVWLGPRLPRPPLIAYVEDRDLWRWALSSSRGVSEWLFSIPRTFEAWDEAAKELERDFGSVAKIGEAFLRLKRERVAKVCDNVRWLTLAGHRIPVVNHAWDMSEIGEYLCEKFPEAVCGGYYFDRADRRQWGFRSRGDFDVAALCKPYGGGGHTAAASFTSEIGWLP